MLFFESKPTQFVGIDIGSGGIKLVELRGQNKRPYLYTYAFSDVDVPLRAARTDEERAAAVDATAQMIKDIAAGAKTTSNAAIASLPQRDVFSTIISIPHVEPKDFASTVAYEIEKLLPFPLVEAQLDTRKIEPLPSEVEQYKKIDRVFVTAARKKVIQLYSEIFTKAGFKLQAIETETFAAIRALLGTDPAPTIIIDMGKLYTSFTYVVRTVPIVDVVIETGGDKLNAVLARAWNKEVSEIEDMKIELFEQMTDATTDPAIDAILQPVFIPIIKEIELVLNTARHGASAALTRPDKIILTGGAARCPGLARKIETQFSVKTYAGDPWARVVAPSGLKPVLDRIGPRFTIAIGLAQRLISGGQ